MFANKIPFLISMSRSIRFGTIEALPNRKHGTIMGGIKDILKVYHNWGFGVKTALMDGELAGLRGDLADQQVTLNVTGRDEHVGDTSARSRRGCVASTRHYSSSSFQHEL